MAEQRKRNFEAAATESSDDAIGATLTAPLAPPGDNGVPSSDVNAGSVAFKIQSEQGRGGLGRVVRAQDLRLDRTVAIKELLHRVHTSETRFLHEAKITARL